MAIWSVFAISRSGMDLEQLRAEVAAYNIAHANSVVTPGGEAIRPLKVTGKAAAVQFEQLFKNSMANSTMNGVEAVVAVSDVPPRRVQDSAHPLADKSGFVSYPGINIVEEMMALTVAVRSYEANVVTFNAMRNMMQKALEIGGRNG